MKWHNEPSAFDLHLFQCRMKTMAHKFTDHFHVRQHELNSNDELPNRALAHLFQETSMRASTDAGFGVEWYAEHNSVWVIHQMTLEHLRPICYLDELAITTWLSDMGRVRSHREYLARDAKTGEIVARGRAHWAHLDRQTLFPARIPASILAQFAPDGVRAIPRLEPRLYPPPANPIERRAIRRVQHYEADSMQHVNNAIYYDWIEETIADLAPSLRLCVRRHDIEYMRGALPGDEVEVVTRLTGAGRCASIWESLVARAGEVLVRDRMTALWIDRKGRPARNTFV